MSRKIWTRVLLASGALVVVVAAVLFQTLVPIKVTSITKAKEMVLRDDLFTLRWCIDHYTLDKQKAPQSLQDLVSAGYLKAIPKDPFTGSTDTWRVTTDDTLIDPSQTQPGITDVHSGASGTGTDGSAYSSW